MQLRTRRCCTKWQRQYVATRSARCLESHSRASLQVMGLAHKANIHQMFDVLRQEGDLQLIGAEAGILEDKWRKWVLSCFCIHQLEALLQHVGHPVFG